MSISSSVTQKLSQFQAGEVITYSDFSEFANMQAVALVLSRLTKGGKIKRISKGKFYLPKETKFGAIGPSDANIIQSILRTDQGSYLSGLSAYSALGLTTQVPSEITIFGSRYNRRTRVGKLRIQFKKSKVATTAEDVPLMQILDSIKGIKKIPDSSVNDSLQSLRRMLEQMSKVQLEKISNLSLGYRPFVRAILGAILESFGEQLEIQKIRKTLNPLSSFELKASEIVLPTMANWNIK